MATFSDYVRRRNEMRQIYPDDLLEDLKDEEPTIYEEAMNCDAFISNHVRSLESSVSPIALLPSILTKGWDQRKKHRSAINWSDMENILKLYAIGLYFKDQPLTDQAEHDKKELSDAIKIASISSKHKNGISAEKRLQNTNTYLRFGMNALDIFFAPDSSNKKYDLALTVSDELVYIGERYYIKASALLTDITGTVENIGYAREEETKKGMDGSQITGASSSYARKYALNGLFLIDDTKDSDATNMGEEITKEKAEAFIFETGKHKGKSIKELYETNQNYLQWWLDQGKDEDIKKMITLVTDLKPTPIPSEEEQQEILGLMNDLNGLVEVTNTDYDKLLAHYNVSSNSEMTIEQLKDAVEKLKEKLC